jgi:hypothetical protein
LPESLTRRARPWDFPTPPWGGRHHLGMVAGFSSEWWPVSNRNPGRLHFGIPGRNASESPGRGIAVRLEMFAQIFRVKSARDVGDGSLVDIEDDLGLHVALKRKHHVAGVDADLVTGRGTTAAGLQSVD